MKPTTLAALAVATLAIAASTPAEAGQKSRKGYKPYKNPVQYCHAPVYKTHTVEVCRDVQCRTAYDHCGRPVSYHVVVVTYRDHYSDGSVRTWTRVLA